MGTEVNFSARCSAAVTNDWSCFSAPFICVNGVDRKYITLLLSGKRQTKDKGKGKKIKQSHYRPGQALRVPGV